MKEEDEEKPPCWKCKGMGIDRPGHLCQCITGIPDTDFFDENKPFDFVEMLNKIARKGGK